jgi:signal transduction histidine kinase/ActR/RegA family two-component response regulator
MANLDRLMDKLDGGIGMFVVEGNETVCRYFNDGFFELLGTSREDREKLFGDDLLKQIHPEDAGEFSRKINEAIENNTLLDADVRMAFGNGATYRWIGIRATHEPSGESGYIFYGVFRDAGIEKSLRENYEREAMKRRAAESSLIAASSFNITRNTCIELSSREAMDEIQRINPLTHQILMSAARNIPDDAQRKQFIDLMSHEGLLELAESGQNHTELTYRRKVNGAVIWVRSWIEVVFDPRSGDAIAFVYTENINEEHIRNGIMEHMLEHNYSDIVYVELMTGKAHHLKSGELISGRDKTGDFGEMVGLVTEKCISEAEKAEVRRTFELGNLRTGLENDAVISLQYRAYGSDADDIRILECEAYYFDERKEIIVISQQDITESYREAMAMNDELNKALEEARKADNAKDDFLSQMSRDLRTPINSILGMTELAAGITEDAELLGYFDRIKEENNRLLNIINRFVEMAFIDSSRIELHCENCHINDLVSNIRAAVDPLLEAKNQRLIIRIEKRAVKNIYADPERLCQIFVNLITNAVAATPEGGTIYMTERDVTNDGEKVLARFTLTDNGKGMSREFLEICFDPFTKEAGEESEGTGLGLAIARTLTELFGGTITADSRPGRGSSFRVEIPFAIAPAHEPLNADPDEIAVQSPPAGKFILIVDDNAINNEITKSLLEKKGYRVAIAENGLEAVELFDSSELGHFSAILMDIRMPVMDGLEAARTIREMKRADAQVVPVIAMTANAYDEDMRKSREAGMDAHLSKPVLPEQLYETLAKYTK